MGLYYCYAIKSLHRNYIYKGITDDLERRINQHNKGYNKTTKPYAPFKLIYSKSFNTGTEARDHEKWLKSSSGRRFLSGL